MKIDFKSLKLIDWFLYILPMIFVVLGLAIIYSLTYYSNIKTFYSQLTFAAVGTILMIVFTFLDYRQLKAASKVLYFVGIGLLVLVLVVGKHTFGASRWIDLGFFDFQPSELFKLILIIFLSSYLSDKIGKLKLKHILFALICTFVPVGLVMMQPDLGTAIIFMLIFVVLLFSCKLSTKQIIAFIILISVAIPTGWYFLKDYQRERLVVFLNPSHDPYGAGYNITQSLITVGSGGLWGKGFGHGPQSQLNFLPVAHTDFVFAGTAEAIGFAGSTVLLVLIMVFLLKVIGLTKVSKDNFGSLVAIGIATMIFFQALINIGMNIGLMPVTGIPLPFISYGGSSLVVMLMAVGILQSIHFRHKKITFK